jgi:3-deoxy-7-phosphoheptulonate synthase
MKPDATVIEVPTATGGRARLGGGRFAVIAGPCAGEGREQILGTARAVAAAGATFLRGGAYKPRTSPYAFQGLKEEGLALLEEARAATGLPVVTEVLDTAQMERVARSADVVQVGARNMQNFALLEAVGGLRQPVILKRGLSATIQELLMAAEYILKQGNYQVILCERGIRTFETMTRNTLDIGAIPLLKRLSHLPVIVDPSHATGDVRLVAPCARAALAVGADGIMVEVHPTPAKAMSDGPQSLDFAAFAELMAALRSIAPVVGLEL